MNNRGEFVKLQLASFISQTGSHFLTIALSGYVLLTSHSVVKAALIFVLSYLPSVFVSGPLGAWIDNHLSRWLLARNELFSIATSAACGVALFLHWPSAALCFILALRSVFLFITRSAASRWIKHITPPEIQAKRIRYFFLSFFLSTAVAGVLAGTILSQAGILTVVIVDIATYLVSFVLDLMLNDLPVQSRGDSRSINVITTISEILAMRDLRRSFLGICLSQAIFQGAYSVLVSLLPIQIFQMGFSGVGAFQISASLGITFGFLVVSAWPDIFQGESGKWPFRLLATLAAGSLLGLGAIIVLPTGLLLFFSMNFAYECVWLFHSSEFFSRSPSQSIGRFQFTLTSSASFLMALSTLSYSFLIEEFGLAAAVCIMLFVGLTLWCVSLRNPSASRGLSYNVKGASK